ncbi:DUF5343 domain-containing protein [Plantibacter sp. YIM 135249]|uniref:DUF5343 domain-containing protein n=1 Tax=Plantibacter sp. YIM 135249 TaxID=3423918 RepID=UPI003D3476EB
MPTEVPYMMSITNVPAILEKIRTAGTPPKFTHEFLKSTLGFSGSNDRGVIKVLRQMGFLSADSVPTPRYNEYRGDQQGKAIAIGLREGWPDFFLADEKIYERSNSQIQGIAKSLTGAGDSVAQKIASTFKAFADKADWSGPVSQQSQQQERPADSGIPERELDGGGGGEQRRGSGGTGAGAGLFELHHDIHIHLPPTNDVSVYRAIFQAIKAELM